MSTTLVRPTIEQVGNERELRVMVPADVLAELGFDPDEPMVLEINDGTLVIRRATIVEQTAGALAKYAKNPPPTLEELEKALAQAVAEENAGYE